MDVGGADRGVPPRPDGCADLAEFIEKLRLLRVWAGAPPYRAIARQAGPLLRPPQQVAQSTIGDVFQARRRRLDLDLVVAIVRALGLDEGEVDAWRRACVRVHAEAKRGGPAGVFRALPPDLSTFTGREAELDRLLARALGGDGRNPAATLVCAIEGMAGIGKTRLAVHAAYGILARGRCRELQLFVNLRGFDPEHPPADPAAVLDAFLRALEVPAQQIPAGLDARAALFRDRMHGRDALIVLDNAADEAQVRDLIPAHGCLVLITSRRALTGLDGAEPHRLEIPTRAAAVELFTRIVGDERVAAEPEEADAIVGACGNLPLAVALAGARLRSRPAWTLAYLRERLERRVLDAAGAGALTLRGVFDLSFQGLGAAAGALFLLLGLFPGDAFTAETAAVMAAVGADEALDLLEALQDEHLVSEESQGRYSLHDLLRAYAAERARAELPDDVRRDALERLVGWYAHAVGSAMDAAAPQRRPVDLEGIPAPRSTPAFDGSHSAFAWCDRELGNLVTVIRAAHEFGFHDAAWKIPLSLQYFFQSRVYPEQFLVTHEIALESARAVGSLAGEARLMAGFASAHSMVEKFDDALDAALRMYDLADRLGDFAAQATAAGLTARAYRETGDAAQAVTWTQRAAGLQREHGNRYTYTAVLLDLGNLHSESGRFVEAEAVYRTLIDLNADGANANARAYPLASLGSALLGQGRPAQAIEYFRQGIELHLVEGRYLNAANALTELGDSFAALAEDDQAVHAWERALEIYRQHDARKAGPLAERLARAGGRVEAANQGVRRNGSEISDEPSL